MASTSLFSAPISDHQYPLSIQHLSSTSNKLWQSNTIPTKSPLILLRASPTPTVDKQEDEESSTSTEPISSIPFGGCKACGKAEVERGCNGEGRMQGGIATVPGFGWWPIKAYRPCPDFVASGGRYRRQGQSMDEVAGFGSVPRISPTTAAATPPAPAAGETQSSVKKQEPRKFKR